MRKIKYLLLSLILSLALLFGGCTVMNETADWEEELSGEQNQNQEDNLSDSHGDKANLPISDGEEDHLPNSDGEEEDDETVSYGESYTSKEEVALYLHLYEELPPNFITKKEAKKLGWVSSEGNLSEVAPGMSIGGDYFGNYEGILPEGKDYHECDIDSDGGYRNAKRIVYSDDGCIYYTEDHYETFELLYGEE